MFQLPNCRPQRFWVSKKYSHFQKRKEQGTVQLVVRQINLQGAGIKLTAAMFCCLAVNRNKFSSVFTACCLQTNLFGELDLIVTFWQSWHFVVLELSNYYIEFSRLLGDPHKYNYHGVFPHKKMDFSDTCTGMEIQAFKLNATINEVLEDGFEV